MPRLLVLTIAELTRDPRARRAALEGRRRAFDVAGLCVDTGDPVELDGVQVARVRGGRMSAALRTTGLGGLQRQRPLVRELRGLFRLARLGARTAQLHRRGRGLGHFDVVHANDLDTLPAGWLLARRSGARLVYDAHELYAEQEPDPPRIFRRVALALERALARRADAVITVSEPIATELQRTLGLAGPVIAWLNCPERSHAEPDAPHDGPLRAIYQGAMGPGRPLGDLLEAAVHAEGAELTLRVVGVDADALVAEIRARGLDDRVRLEPPVPPHGLVEALRGYDVGLIINRPVTRNDELVFPNKLFEYLMAGLAVVAPRLPGLTLIEDERIGVTFEPARPELLGRALTALAGDRSALEAMRSRARALALDRLNAEAQRDRLAAAWGI